MSSPEKSQSIKKSSIQVAFRFRGWEPTDNPDDPLMDDIFFSETDEKSLNFETNDFTFDHLFHPNET